MAPGIQPTVSGRMKDQIGRYPTGLVSPQIQDKTPSITRSPTYNINVNQAPQQAPQERIQRNRVPSAMPSKDMLSSLFDLNVGSNPAGYAFGK
jgi:hypothetical protein